MAEPRPAALPPAQRTVGQLVAETIRLYGDHFWLGLALGLPIGIIDVASLGRSVLAQTVVAWALGPLVCAAWVRASMLVLEVPWSWRAFVIALVVYLPFPILLRIYVLPGIVWFGLIGLAVPAYLDGRASGIGDALRRGIDLGRADVVHAIGGLATLCIVYGLSRGVLLVLLHTQGDQAQKIAITIADIVLSPLLYIGGALLYLDQRARLGSGLEAPSAKPTTPGR